jgi:FKBP-type peptidyl-prolyl cis-trans isomerase
MSDSEGENTKNPQEPNDMEDSNSDVEDKNDNDDSTETEYEGGAVKKKIITKGSGWEMPKKGADVSVHYVGTLLDGSKFDSSRDRGDPFNFKLGQGAVIKGWDKGVATMKKGEKSLFTIAASHAYGESGSPPKIPANATLQFEIELLSWTSEEDVTTGGEVKKTVVQEGKGWEKPDELAKCTVKYSCKVGDKYVIGGDTPAEATLDLASVDVPEGVVEALKKMKKGERASVRVASEYGYGKEGNSKLGIPSNAALVYDIELVDFPEAPKTYSMKNDEKVEHGNKLKEVGNAFFKKDQLKRARHFYDEASKLFQHEKNLEGAIKKQVDQLSVAAKGNLAACALKQGDYSETVKVSTEVLALDSGNVKVLFRRAQAYHNRKDYDEALEDLKSIIEKEGKTTAVVSKLMKEVKAELAKERSAQAKLFGGMFNKISLVSDNEIAQAKKAAAEKKPAADSSDDDEPPAMDESADKAEGKAVPAKAEAAAQTKEEPSPPKAAQSAQQAKPEEAKSKSEDAGEGEEEMTPEQAAAMAAMNEELFGIVEEGQAGLAAASSDVKATPTEPKGTVAEEPQVTVHTSKAAASEPASSAEPKPASSAEPKPASGKEPKPASGKERKSSGKEPKVASSKESKPASSKEPKPASSKEPKAASAKEPKAAPNKGSKAKEPKAASAAEQKAKEPEVSSDEPKPVATEPKPVAAEPKPVAAEPKPAAAEPKPVVAEPKAPATAEPTTTTEKTTTAPKPATEAKKGGGKPTGDAKKPAGGAKGKAVKK